MRPAESFVRRLRGLLSELSAAERKLAELLLDFPGELASYTASELAALAGVSNATVTRLIQRLGYGSYDDARRQVRDERQSGAALFQPLGQPVASGDSRVASHLQQSHVNLAQTFSGLDDGLLDQLVPALIRAHNLLIFGSRGSQPFAAYLRWQMLQVLPRVRAIPGPGETLAEHLAGLGPRDCVVAFALRRQIRQLQPLLQACAQSQTQLLLIGDQLTPAFAGATWTVTCQCSGIGPLDNHVAVMALCNLLASRVIESAGPAARKRLAAIEALHDDLGEL